MNRVIIKDIDEIIASPIVDWSRFQNKTVLVTGANGMLPSYMVYALLFLNQSKRLNTHIIAQVRNKEKGEIIFAEFLNDSYFHLLVQDVVMPYKLTKHVDFIIHAASQASPKYYATDPVGTLMANIEGTINILKLSQANNAESTLFFSSAEVYGKVEKEWISENDYGYLDPTSTRSCYAESKRMGEQLCCSWNQQYETHCKTVRLFHTFSPNMKLDDGRVFADFVNNVVKGENIILKSTGEAKRAFCYATDATIAFFKILLDGKDSESYNVGNPYQEISIKNLAEMIIDSFSEKGLHLIFDINENDRVQKSAVKSVLPDISKIMSLGWTPTVSVKDGFRRVIYSKLETK